MAIGNVNPDSDFDVIIGTQSRRIFTARFFSIIAFGIFGWRRKKLDHKESARDKICFNHFVTPVSYRLSPPHNYYWKTLYKNLVPVFGKPEIIQIFLAANKNWLEKIPLYQDDLRHLHQFPAITARVMEKCLKGKIGDWMENILKKAQIKRIELGLKHGNVGYQPRIIYNDDELEFHPDTKRIQEFLYRQ